MPTPIFATLEAEQFLRDRNIVALPVNPSEIAKDLGIVVQAKPAISAGVSGMLIRHDDQFGIAYATHIDNEGFQRFSVSHELGHYLLPGHIDAVLGNENIHESHAGFVSDDRYEREADHFAAGLLMPSFLFKNTLETTAEGLGAVDALSAQCKTSLTATAIRYAQLTDSPTAAIQSVGNRIEWCFMSDPLKEIKGLDWIKKMDFLSKNTVTYSFNSNSDNIRTGRRESGETNLQDWFGGHYDVTVVEEIVGLGAYDRTLTILSVEELDIDVIEEDDELEDSWTLRF